MRRPRKQRLADKIGTKSGSPQRLRLLEKLSLEDLRRKVERYRDAYYNGQAIISDEEFDALEERLKKLSPKDPLLSKVGHTPVSGRKVTLPHPMGSLPKVRAATGAQRWLDKHPYIVVSDKLDGVSVLIKNNGKTHYNMYTRGNGTQGQDISYLVPTVAGIGMLRRGQAVRGEIVMPKSNFSANWAEKFANPRNLVSGVVNSNKADPAVVKDLVFIAHQLVVPATTLSRAAPYLKSNGFNVVNHVTLNRPTIQELESYLELRKKQSKFEIDGLVLQDPDSDDVVAYKKDISKEAEVKSIEWELSKYKYYKPVVILRRPVQLSGASVKRVSGHNARFLVENGIGPGARILITRSGEVIPKIVGVLRKAKPTFPKEYTWDANKVEILGEPKDDATHMKLTAKRLSEALRILGVPNIREKHLLKLVEGGIDSLYELFVSDDTDFMNAGLGPTQSDQLYTGLKEAKLRATHAQMMQASGIFPRGFGATRFEAILEDIPYTKLSKLTDRTAIRNIAELPGFTEQTAQNFVKYLPKYERFINKLRWKERKRDIRTDNPLRGHVVVFTGFRNRQWEATLKSRGAKVGGGVTKKTTLVVYSKPSTKVDKAKKLGIRVMSKEAFARSFDLPLS